MKTGAEDDSLSTPIFAFSTSSARAVPLAASTSRPISTSRTDPLIPFPPWYSLEPFGHALIPPDKGAVLLQRLFQLFRRNVARNRIAGKRQRGGGAGGLAHRKAGAGDPRRRLPVMGH